MPPNLTKIFFHWGLGPQLRKIALKSEALTLSLCSYASRNLLLCIDPLYS